jgi:hypothetical protein
MPGDPEAYTDAVDRVLAFKCDGQLADDPGSRPCGHLATIAAAPQRAYGKPCQLSPAS